MDAPDLVTYVEQSSVFLNRECTRVYSVRCCSPKSLGWIIHDVINNEHFFVENPRRFVNDPVHEDVLGTFYAVGTQDSDMSLVFESHVHKFNIDMSVNFEEKGFFALVQPRQRLDILTLAETVKSWASHNPACAFDEFGISVKVQSMSIRPYYAVFLLYARKTGNVLLRRDHCYFMYYNRKDPMLYECGNDNVAFEDIMYLWIHKYRYFGVSVENFKHYYMAFFHDAYENVFKILKQLEGEQKEKLSGMLKYASSKELRAQTMARRDEVLRKLKLCPDTLAHVKSFL